MIESEVMRERPILFSGAMVRAILDGRKTQTRRVVARSNSYRDGSRANAERWAELDFSSPRIFIDQGPSPAGNPGPYLHVPDHADDCSHRIYPERQPGDRLWIRETFLIGYESDGNGNLIQFDANGNELAPKAFYRATSPDLEWMDDDGYHLDATPWKPSIFMPRWASRITLEVIDAVVHPLHWYKRVKRRVGSSRIEA